MIETIDCIYCKGRGFNYTDLMYKKDCLECGGTGTRKQSTKRKTISIERKTHEGLTNMAHDLHLSLVDLMRKIVKDHEDKGVCDENLQRSF